MQNRDAAGRFAAADQFESALQGASRGLADFTRSAQKAAKEREREFESIRSQGMHAVGTGLASGFGAMGLGVNAHATLRSVLSSGESPGNFASGSLGAAGLGLAQAMRGINVFGLPVGELAAQLGGGAAVQNVANRTTGRITEGYEDLARYGVEIDDKLLRQDVESVIQQENRVERFRERVGRDVGRELGGDALAGSNPGTALLKQILDVLREKLPGNGGGGSPR